MSTQKPGLSVVVCTHNRGDDAVECVQALLHSKEAERLQFIVVDNASDAANSERLRHGLNDPRVELVSEPTPGLSHARNRGLSLARADWIAYLDDDALPFPDWAARALELAESVDANVGLIGGAVLPKWPNHTSDPAVPPTQLGSRWRDLLSLVEVEQRPPGSNVPHIVGCNLLVRRDLLQELGGFSAELGRTPDRLLGGEEIAIAREIAERGLKVDFASRLRVYHKISTERLKTAWIRKRAEAEGELLWKCSPRAIPKILLSIPFLAVASTLRTLPTGSPSDYDHHVRLWHNLGFLKSAVASTLLQHRPDFRNRPAAPTRPSPS
ncbi:MAG: glycosyltransferase family 2 protein [Myxococcota bacterium]